MDEVTKEPVLSENEIEKKWENHFRGLFEIWKRDELVSLEEQQEQQLRKLLNEKIEEIEKSRKPPTKEEIQALLDQEYLSFKVKLFVNKEEREFMITELPQDAEKKFYKQFKTQLLEKAGDIAAISQATMDQGMEAKIKTFLEGVEYSMDMLAEACVTVLNPRGEEKEITRSWVQKNISSSRMWNIVKAQIEVNRLRDFFSQLSQSGMQVQRMIPNSTVASSLR